MNSPIILRYAPPPPHLGERIGYTYYMRQDVGVYDELERADRPQLRIMLSGEGHYLFPGGRKDRSWPITLLGPTSRRVSAVGVGPIEVIGAGLLPPAWVKIAGAQAESLIDRAIDARDLFGDSAQQLHDAVRAEQNTDARFALIAAFIDRVTDTDDIASFWFTRIVNDWLLSSIDPQVEALAKRCKLGVRQIERLTKRYYGLPPMTLARKHRALRAAAALARGDDLATVGLGDCFYDQSHLIRELKRFAGLTPQQIRNISDLSLHGRISTEIKSLRGKVSPIISDI